MTYPKGHTDTRSALIQALEMFQLSSNTDPETVRVLDLLTDGHPHDGTGVIDACTMSSTLFNSGIATHVIGVGDQWDPNKLVCLMEDPEDIVTIDSYADLSNEKSHLAQDFGLIR